jgi:DNA-directed RNA polymerase subunit M/transcription elongation factor TFIIS
MLNEHIELTKRNLQGKSVYFSAQLRKKNLNSSKTSNKTPQKSKHFIVSIKVRYPQVPVTKAETQLHCPKCLKVLTKLECLYSPSLQMTFKLSQKGRRGKMPKNLLVGLDG